MIYVTKSQFLEVEYLIKQSLQGNHILFDLEALRKVFWEVDDPFSSSLTEEEAYSVEHHIERLILQPNLAQKRAYLENLDALTYRKVVMTYFSIVENRLHEKEEKLH